MKKGELRREQILECAQKLFSRQGYYETQVSDIVEMAHIAKGTIYQYFKSKEDLFGTLLETYRKQWEEAIAVDMDQYKAPYPQLSLAHLYVHHRITKSLAFFNKDPDRSNIILRMGPGLNPVFESQIVSFEEGVIAVLKRDVELGKRNGHIDASINAEFAANMILGGVLRISHYYFVMKKADFTHLPLEMLTNEAVRLILNSLGMQG